jgi:SAM-dependent methyltransferase
MTSDTVKEIQGTCPVCLAHTKIVSTHKWLRDHYRCAGCGSLPRERALYHALNSLYPSWAEGKIHECSPVRPAPPRRFRDYSASNFFPGTEPGARVGPYQNQNIESMTFADGEFDCMISMDVLEHVFDPWRAVREMMRVTRLDGVVIFTTPKYPNLEKTRQRARLVGDRVEHILPPEYHGNPVGDGSALVTWDFGQDFEALVCEACHQYPITINQEYRALGIEGSFLEVFIMKIRSETIKSR